MAFHLIIGSHIAKETTDWRGKPVVIRTVVVRINAPQGNGRYARVFAIAKDGNEYCVGTVNDIERDINMPVAPNQWRLECANV